MIKQQLNKLYYQTHQEAIKARQKERYQTKKQQQKNNTKSQLATYYQANNIQVLISLKDYLESSSEKMKFWYRFTTVLNQIKEGVTDIMEIMRLREVMADLISDYWTTTKKQIRITKKWNKLAPAQQAAKKNQWAEELEREEKELLQQLEKQTQNIKTKQKKTTVFNYHQQEKASQGKIQCSECHSWVKELDQENDLCANCISNYR